MIYRANITPGFSLPPLIGPAIVGRDVRIMLESVAREMLRRADATGRMTPGAGQSALDILDEAYARNEISREEYLQKRDDMQKK